MIPKASQRGGGRQLATHLLNEFDNERVHIAEIRGAMAADLHGAFAEWRAQSGGTRCLKYLYSLSINPDPDQGPLTRAQYLDFIERTEKSLGLEGQPRALVFHIKHGREHCHAVWSRINVEKSRAVQLSHDRPKLMSVVREFARDHGLELPAGLRSKNRDRDQSRQERENLQENQQEERTGITKAQRRAEITAAWKESDSGKAFVLALERKGYFLARGDRRAYVVIDSLGEIHSLARYIDGVRTPALVARLAAAFPLDRLPDPKSAKEYARRKREAKLVFKRDFVQAAQARRTQLLAAHQQRRAMLAKKRGTLEARHGAEREALREAHEDTERGIVATRLVRRSRGIIALLARVTGIKALMDFRRRRQDKARAANRNAQVAALDRRHARELQEVQRQERALAQVEKREMRSLATTLRREHLLLVMSQPEPGKAGPAKAQDGQAEPDKSGSENNSGSEGERNGALPSALRDRAARNRRQRERDKSRDHRDDYDR
jgi:hypothetical protein